MRKPFTYAATLAAALIAATAAFAADDHNIVRRIEMKDGSTLTIFKEGKMAMQDKLGRTMRMKPGHVMETKDGERIVMIGDEVARLDTITYTQRGTR